MSSAPCLIPCSACSASDSNHSRTSPVSVDNVGTVAPSPGCQSSCGQSELKRHSTCSHPQPNSSSMVEDYYNREMHSRAAFGYEYRLLPIDTSTRSITLRSIYHQKPNLGNPTSSGCSSDDRGVAMEGAPWRQTGGETLTCLDSVYDGQEAKGGQMKGVRFFWCPLWSLNEPLHMQCRPVHISTLLFSRSAYYDTFPKS